ncbi:MAG: YihY family inner membrane protein [Betaproteobacteria bacterium]
MRRPRLPASVEFVLAVAQRFHEERTFQTAGSLTYTTLLSLVPLLTVALAVASAFPVFEQVVAALHKFIVLNMLPESRGVQMLMEQFNVFARNAGRLTAIGLVGFLVIAVMLMLTIDNALNRIFRVQRGRSLVQNIAMYWTVLTLGPLLIGGSLSLTSFALVSSLGWLNLDTVAERLVNQLPFVLTWAALALLYGLVPARRVEPRHALFGALLAGLVFELAKRGFAFYLAQVPTYTLIYGTFATVPIFLLWLYLSWVVVLGGAVFTALLPGWHARSDLRRVPGQDFADAVRALAMLARAHDEGRPVRLGYIARKLRLLPDRVEHVLERARRLGWAASSGRDRWMLARDAVSIPVLEVYRAFAYDAEALGLEPADLGVSLQDYARRKEPDEQH